MNGHSKITAVVGLTCLAGVLGSIRFSGHTASVESPQSESLFLRGNERVTATGQDKRNVPPASPPPPPGDPAGLEKLMRGGEDRKYGKTGLDLSAEIQVARDPHDARALTQLMNEWLSSDPHGALEYVSEQTESSSSAFRHAIRDYLETLPFEKAVDLSLSLTGKDTLQLSVTSGTFNSWLEEDHNGATIWLAKEGEPTKPYLAGQLAYQAALAGKFDDPEETMDWALGLPQGYLRKSLVTGVSEWWLSHDAKEAVNYIDHSPQPRAFDDFNYRMVQKLKAEHEVQLAKSWAEAISEHDLRELAIEEIRALDAP